MHRTWVTQRQANWWPLNTQCRIRLSSGGEEAETEREGTLRRCWRLSNTTRPGGGAVGTGFMILLYSLHIPNVYFITSEILHNLKEPKATTLQASLC